MIAFLMVLINCSGYFMKKSAYLSLAYAGMLLLSACATTGGGTNEATFTNIGGKVGSALSSSLSMGGDAGRVMRRMGLTTTSLGMLVGGSIGRSLDDQDRQKMEVAAQDALNSNRVQTWGSPDKKTSGTVRPISTTTSAQAGTCRTIQQTVALADGSKHQENVTACKGADGQWEVQ
jgi:surface antigen